MNRRVACTWLVVVLGGPRLAVSQRTLSELQVWRVQGGLTVIQFNEAQLVQLGAALVCVEETARVPPFEHLHMDTPYVAFAIQPSSTLEFTVTDGIFVNYEDQEQTIRHRGGFTLLFRPRGGRPATPIDFRDFVIGPTNLPANAFFDLNNDCLYLPGAGGGMRFALHLRGPMRAFIDLSTVTPYAKTGVTPYLPLFWTTDDGMSLLWVGQADLAITEAGAVAVGRPELAGIPIALIEVYAAADLVGERPPTEAEIDAARKSYPRVPAQPPGSRFRPGSGVKTGRSRLRTGGEAAGVQQPAGHRDHKQREDRRGEQAEDQRPGTSRKDRVDDDRGGREHGRPGGSAGHSTTCPLAAGGRGVDRCR